MAWTLPLLAERNISSRHLGAQAALRRESGRRRRFALERLEGRTLLSGGQLDPSYGNAGVFNDLNFAPLLSSNGLVIQSNDEAVIVGQAFAGPGLVGFGVQRITINGTPDSTFGANSLATADFSGPTGTDQAFGAAIQKDGKIVVVGATSLGSNWAIARFNTDGSLDSTFGLGGQVVTDFGGNDVAHSVAIQPNGDIVVGGTANSGQFAVARYLPSGSLDLGFGNLGKVVVPDNAGSDFTGRVLIQPNGQILLGGYDLNNMVIIRFNGNNGSLDPSFGVGGIAKASFGSFNFAQARDIALQPDGKIVAAGGLQTASGFFFATARFNSNGTLDTTFGTNGEVSTGYTVFDRGNGVIVQSDGKIVVAGQSSGGNGGTARLVRYNANGSLDTGFGTNGTTNVPFGAANGIALESTGKAVIAGSVSLTANGGSPGAARYFLGNPLGEFSFHMAVFIGHDGGIATITVDRNAGTVGQVSVQYATSDGTAAAGVQYAATSGTLVFPAGVSQETFTVPLLADGIVDGTTTVNLSLFNPTGGATLGSSPTALLDIIDAPGSLQFSNATYTVIETAGSAQITVTRQVGDGGPVTVDFSTSDGTGHAGLDYQPTSGTLNFADGQTSATFPVNLIKDPLAVGMITVNLQLTNPTNGATLGIPAQAVLDILVDPGDFVFHQSAFAASKLSGSALITVDRENGSDGDVQVQFATSDGTAKQGINYVPIVGTLDFPAGVTQQTFAVQLLNDNKADGNLSVGLTLSNPQGGATLGGRKVATLIITDAPGQLQFSAANQVVQESAGHTLVVVTRTGGVGGAVTVDYATSNGTAKSGVDYVPASGTVTFTAGQLATVIPVQVLDDGKVGGGNRSFNITLTNPTNGANLGAQATTAITVLDDHQPGSVLDFTGAGHADLGVYRPTTPGEYIVSGFGIVPLGQGGNLPVPGYYDAKDTYTSAGTVIPGYHKSEPALYDPNTATWTISGPNGVRTVVFGQPHVDIPVPQDYDGDGQTDLAVYRPTTGQFFILNSTTGVQVVKIGNPGLDEPVVGDFEGAGRANPAVYEPSTGTWFIMESTGLKTVKLGVPGLDLPVPADYEGIGRSDLAVYRQSTGQWIIIESSQTVVLKPVSKTGLLPVPQDFNGDGKADLAEFDPTTDTWYLPVLGGSATNIRPFGQPKFDTALGLPIAFGTLGAGSPLLSNITLTKPAGGAKIASVTPASSTPQALSLGTISAVDSALDMLGSGKNKKGFSTLN